MDKNFKSLLGLCYKAGFVVVGEESCEKALRNKIAKLVIVATDASDNTKNKFSKKTFFYKVDFFIYGTIDELSCCIGKNNRVSYVITEENFAAKLKQLM